MIIRRVTNRRFLPSDFSRRNPRSAASVIVRFSRIQYNLPFWKICITPAKHYREKARPLVSLDVMRIFCL